MAKKGLTMQKAKTSDISTVFRKEEKGEFTKDALEQPFITNGTQ
jgi:hypothetical protein